MLFQKIALSRYTFSCRKSSSSETLLMRRESWERFIAVAQLPAGLIAKQICHLTWCELQGDTP